MHDRSQSVLQKHWLATEFFLVTVQAANDCHVHDHVAEHQWIQVQEKHCRWVYHTAPQSKDAISA